MFLFGTKALAVLLGVGRLGGRASRIISTAGDDARRQHEFSIAGASQLNIRLSALRGQASPCFRGLVREASARIAIQRRRQINSASSDDPTLVVYRFNIQRRLPQ